MTLLHKEKANIYDVRFLRYSGKNISSTVEAEIKVKKCSLNSGFNYGESKVGNNYNVGFFLGSPDDIDALLDLRHNTNPISSFNKIYFDKECKYPRFKLSEKTSIKRCLKPSIADSCIISKIQLYKYEWYEDQRESKALVAYSSKENSWYFLTNMALGGYPQLTSSIEKQLNHTFSLERKKRILSILVDKGILPNDTSIYYEGPVITLSKSQYDYIYNIQNTYMKITYDTELDQFINQKLQELTPTEATEINKMLKSSDETIVGMGMKLLSNYDLNRSKCTIGLLLLENWQNITDISTFTSVGFKQILQTLGLDTCTRYRPPREHMVNTWYEESTSETDKSFGRDFINSKIEQELQQSINSYKNTFKTLDLDISIVIH